MTNDMGLVPFAYGAQTVRVVTIEGEPWFVLADLCKVLDLTNVGNVLARLDDAVKDSIRLADGNPGNPNKAIVSEAGMYEVVIRSDKPEAVAFRRWITTEVLPAIRKHGAYLTPAKIEEVLTDPDTLIRLATDLKTERAARIEAEQHAAELAAPASAWKHMAAAAGDYAVGDAAKILSRDPAISIGRDRLFAFMAAEGWVYRGQDRRKSWAAYQTQVDCGRLVEKMGKPYLNEKTGETELPAPTIRITAKGLAELHKRLGGTDPLQTMAVAS